MAGYDDGFSPRGDRTGGRRTETAPEPLGVGKVSLIQLRSGPHAPQPTEPNKHTLTEQLVPIQAQRADPGNATAGGPPPTGGGGTPLPAEVRAQMEDALGGNFSAVRVHTSPYAEVISAHAFTRGTDLFFAPGAYDPTCPQGLHLLGHELVHVVQQAQGRVPVNASIGGAPANTDASLEQEADELGAKAASALRDEQARNALKTSIRKHKIPSYEFYPRHNPSVASAVKKFTQGDDAKELEVQATLIVEGSDFDLGPFL